MAAFIAAAGRFIAKQGIQHQSHTSKTAMNNRKVIIMGHCWHIMGHHGTLMGHHWDMVGTLWEILGQYWDIVGHE